MEFCHFPCLHSYIKILVVCNVCLSFVQVFFGNLHRHNNMLCLSLPVRYQARWRFSQIKPSQGDLCGKIPGLWLGDDKCAFFSFYKTMHIVGQTYTFLNTTQGEQIRVIRYWRSCRGLISPLVAQPNQSKKNPKNPLKEMPTMKRSLTLCSQCLRVLVFGSWHPYVKRST